MNINEKVAAFDFVATNGLQASLSDYSGKWIILYFYPRDATPGCTLEGQDFRDQYKAFEALQTVIFGISRDSLASHEKFKCTQAFPFELICDQDEKICQLFNVIKMKSMYGKQVRGIERSTFLIDKEGILRQEWRNLKVKGHVSEVLDTLLTFQNK